MDTAATGDQTRRRRSFWTFVTFMLALTLVFVGLGTWQLQRLAWKKTLIAEATQRTHLPPKQLPRAAGWADIDPHSYNFRPVTVRGTYAPKQTVLVFTSLSEPRGKFSGPGYWVMTPLQTEGGGIVWINRGYIPQGAQAAFADGGAPPAGTITVTGLARITEGTTPFTPSPDVARRVEWVRNIDRLDAFLASPGKRVAPLYIDKRAGAPGALPQGGETKVNFPNRHLEYAATWFGMALGTLAMLSIWVQRQRAK